MMIAKIVERFVEKGVVSKENKIIYEFGLKQGIVVIINSITIFLIGIISGELWNLMIFTMSYLLLRPYAGGYHAESEIGCYVLSTLLMIVVAIISKVMVMNFFMVTVILGFSVSILILLAPVEDHRKPLDNMEVEVYRKKIRKLLLIELAGIVVATYIASSTAKMMAFAIIAIAFMILLGWVKNKLLM